MASISIKIAIFLIFCYVYEILTYFWPKYIENKFLTLNLKKINFIKNQKITLFIIFYINFYPINYFYIKTQNKCDSKNIKVMLFFR